MDALYCIYQIEENYETGDRYPRFLAYAEKYNMPDCIKEYEMTLDAGDELKAFSERNDFLKWDSVSSPNFESLALGQKLLWKKRGNEECWIVYIGEEGSVFDPSRDDWFSGSDSQQ